MTNNRNTPHGEPPAELSDDAAAFDDEGLSPMSEEELQERNFRSEILLEQERAEREAFAEELEEENQRDAHTDQEQAAMFVGVEPFQKS